ncbi:DUF2982 domain-containing protein [Rheinheimera sp.]|uniref:DUF2982 domain-containing protein n=1 Tax=Rheinheimera sp. TaxID=1869214 RepID=UPI0027B94800|nr:DUF2982 domain-containing protein [Rheinheimera sp.]
MRYLYRDQSAKGGIALLLSATLVLLFFILLLSVAPDLTTTPGWLVLFLLLIAGIFVGYAKITEPFYAVELCPQGIRYHHRRGSWLLAWTCLSHVSVPTLAGQGELAYVGFKVTDYDQFLATLPLRLAVKLLVEQRHLLLAALRQNCPSGTCASTMLVEHTEFNSKKCRYSGVQAMFAHRMQHLSQLLGAELFIPVQVLPVDATEFCRTVNQSRLIYLKKTAT